MANRKYDVTGGNNNGHILKYLLFICEITVSNYRRFVTSSQAVKVPDVHMSS